jgi:hypothetical protein
MRAEVALALPSGNYAVRIMTTPGDGSIMISYFFVDGGRYVYE